MRKTTKKTLESFGFKKEIERVSEGKCPFCGSDRVKRENFRDELSWREFKLSGLCQACQDDIFGD